MRRKEIPIAIAEMKLENLTREQLAVMRHLSEEAEAGFDERIRHSEEDSSRDFWKKCANATFVLTDRVLRENLSRRD